MKRQFVKAEDVARLAGVSRSAVSRTFTPGASVSAEVRQRVERAAQALGYRVNRLARSLISAESNLVGVVGTNLSTPFISLQLDALSRALLRRSMQCLLLNAADAQDGIAPLIDLILEFRVRAIVIMSGTPPAAIVDECLANGVRVILIHRQTDDAATDTVVSDDAGGARLAADRLMAAGCRRPGLVISNPSSASLMRRREAFVAHMAQNGIETAVWADGPTAYQTGLASADFLLAQGVDGVFGVSDLLALGFLDGARKAGRRVPQDVSVVGFDDIPQSSWAAYGLTTVRQSPDDIMAGVIAAIDREDAHGAGKLHHVVPVSLIERSSVRG